MKPCCPTCGHIIGPQEFMVSLETNSAAMGGTVVKLSPQEAEILSILANCAPRTARHREILLGVYGSTWSLRTINEAATLKVFICELRKKIAQLDVSIETVHRTGYRLAFKQRAAA